jgi:hypothetical protein
MNETEYVWTVEFEIRGSPGVPVDGYARVSFPVNVLATTSEKALEKAKTVSPGDFKLGCVLSIVRVLTVHAK